MLRVCVGLLVSACISPAWAWGALAIDSNHGSRHGVAYDYADRTQAQQAALAACGVGCTVVVTFQRGCAAYAVDRSRGSSIYGWAAEELRAPAHNAALVNCAKAGGAACGIRVWGCSTQ